MNSIDFENLVVNGVHFTTVQKHVSWETLTEDNAYQCMIKHHVTD